MVLCHCHLSPLPFPTAEFNAEFFLFIDSHNILNVRPPSILHSKPNHGFCNRHLSYRLLLSFTLLTSFSEEIWDPMQFLTSRGLNNQSQLVKGGQSFALFLTTFTINN